MTEVVQNHCVKLLSNRKKEFGFIYAFKLSTVRRRICSTITLGFIFLLSFLSSFSYATPKTTYIQGDDNRRYLALMLVNDNEDYDFRPAIETAHSQGFNAVYLSVRWDAIKCHNAECATNPNWQPNSHWQQIDQQIEKAKSLGMKIAFRIHLGSADLTPYGMIANRSEYLWGPSSHMKTPEGSIHLGGWQFRMFSYAKQSTIDKAKGFVGEVLGRYRNLIDENNLLFVTITTGSSQELEYSHNNLLDYSEDMVGQYRTWYKNKYCTDPMVAPTDFGSEAGKRWYVFRHKKLKEFLDQMVQQVKSVDSRIKVINDFGSCFDGSSTKRGTMAFKNLGENTDGVKVNDDYHYDHRFSMDILRTNMPGKWIMNETLLIDGQMHVVPEFIHSSFAHGAKIFCVVTGDPNKINALASTFNQIHNQWLEGTNGIMPTLSTSGSVSYTFSEAFSANYDGNRFSTSTGRNIYQEWLNIYNNNPSNAKPVNVYFDERDLDDNATCTVSSQPVSSDCAPTAGYVVRKRWTNVSGTSVSDLMSQTNNFTKTPATTSNLTELRTETNWGDNYGQQIQGYITAPQSGSYVFWISGDDNSELWLSSSEDPSGMQRVAWVRDWTNALEWGRESNQKSAAVNLTACQRYYFEIRHKDGEYWDNLAVGWSRPGQSTASPSEIIPGTVLSPYTATSSPGCTTPSAPVLTASASTITSGQSSTLSASGCTGTVNWSTGQSGSSISVSPTQTSTYTATCTVSSCTSPSASVTITVSSPVQTESPSQPVSSGCVVNKVRLVFRNCCFFRLQGATIQGSNDQSSWNTLYTFTSEANGTWQEFTFSNTTAYRYVRFVAGPQSAGELLELEFWNGGQKLSGTLFGSAGNFDNNPAYSYRNAMDGVLGEMWHGADLGSQNFVGLDLAGCSGSTTTSPSPCTPPSAPVLTASASTITSGQSSTLSASGCTGTVNWSTGQSGSSISVSPTQTSTYTATCTVGSCTSPSASVTVTVSSPGCTTPSAPVLTASASTITSGQSSTLSASGCGGTVNWSTGQSGGSISVSPTQTSIYTATCTVSSCTSPSASVTVTVSSPVQTESPSQPVSSGCVVNKVRLVFRNCCFFRLQGATIQGSNDQSSWNTLYTFTSEANGTWQEFTFSNTTAYRYVRFVAGPQSAGELLELEFWNGGQKLSGTLFGSAGNFDNNPAYSYRNAMDGVLGEMWHGADLGSQNFVGLDLAGCSGSTTTSPSPCTPPSAPVLTASASTITSGQSSTLSASGCTGTVNWSTGQSGSSISVSPTQTSTYTATCTVGSCTSPSASVTVTVSSPSSSTINCGTVEGFFDSADCNVLAGWAYDRSNPNAVVSVDIYEGSTLIQGGFPASNFRQDLLNAGKGNGFKAFSISTPSKLKDGKNRSISIRVTGCNYTLSNSPRTIRCSTNSRIGVEEETALSAEPEVVLESAELTVWPNPTSGEFEVSFFLEKDAQAVLSVVDLIGTGWYEQKLVGTGQHKEKIRLANAVAGIYIIQLKKLNSLESKKIIVVR